MKKVKLLINKPLKHYKAGTVLVLNALKDGLPEHLYWRARLKDAEFDNCVTIIKDTKNSTEKEEAKKEDQKQNISKKSKKIGDKHAD